MLKQSASGVLASRRSSTYRSVRLASSLAAALLDGLFDHPAGRDGMMRARVTEQRRVMMPGAVGRTLAGLCALLWVAGSVSAAYGSLTPQWTTPHCPQGASHHGQHSQSHCVWHCDGVDAQATGGRVPGSQADPSSFLSYSAGRSLQTVAHRLGAIPRGPPVV
mgnify:FL=1